MEQRLVDALDRGANGRARPATPARTHGAASSIPIRYEARIRSVAALVEEARCTQSSFSSETARTTPRGAPTLERPPLELREHLDERRRRGRRATGRVPSFA